MYSALKRDGKPLYEYARAGITLERQARNIVIHALTLLDYSPPFLRLRVACSKGTYIRVLGEDIGRALGCGAHLNALRRIQVGDLVLAGAVTLDQVAQLPQAERVALLLPVDSLLQSFPEVRLSDVLSDRFLHGQRLALQKELGVTESVDSVALAVEKNAENAAEKDVENSKNEENAENAVTAVTALTISRLPDAVGRVRVYRHSNGQLLGSGQLQEYQVLAPERLISTSF
jgi:tRNA pseudouridine55 synthase